MCRRSWSPARGWSKRSRPPIGVGDVAERAFERGRRAPHHERILAVVLVVAAAHSGRAEALSFIEMDGDAVGPPYLQRKAGLAVADALIQLREQRRGDPLALMIAVDRDVHDVPDGVVARADQVADEALLAAG